MGIFPPKRFIYFINLSTLLTNDWNEGGSLILLFILAISKVVFLFFNLSVASSFGNNIKNTLSGAAVFFFFLSRFDKPACFNLPVASP